MNRAVPVVALLSLVFTACTTTEVGQPTTTTMVAEAAATTVAAATTSQVRPTTTTRPPDGFGGEVVVGVDREFETLNPFSPMAFGNRLVGNATWALVYDIDPVTWDRIPDTVAALPSHSGGVVVNSDGTMTVRYDVVDEAVWSDGIPISGQDVAFTAEAMRDMRLSGQGQIDEVMGTVIFAQADGKTAFVTFEEPTLAFEDALWIILPSHHLEGVDLVDGTDGTDWPSGGPFVVDEWNPVDLVRFVRNAQYWKVDDGGRAVPYLDALTFVLTKEPGFQGDEPTSPVGSFGLKEIDIAADIWSQEDIDRIEAIDSDAAVVDHVVTPIIEQLTFNFSDERFDVNPGSANEFIDFRRALASSIDRPQLLADTGVPWFPETPGMLNPMGTSAWSVYETGIHQAPELPEGAASTLSTTGNGDYRIRIGNALEPAFSAAGVSYAPDYIDSTIFFNETIFEGAFDVGMWAWVSDGGYRSQLAMLEVFDPRSSPPEEGFRGGGNYGRWGEGSSANDNTAQYSELVSEARTTLDPLRFAEIIVQAEAILATELPVIPLFSRGTVAAIWTDEVGGVVNNGSRSDLTWNLEDWQRIGE